MIDHISIFLKGGQVLWKLEDKQHRVQGRPIDALVANVLIEERASNQVYHTGEYTLKWILHNDLDLVFVVVYQRVLQLLWGDELLQLVRSRFCDLFREPIVQFRKAMSEPTVVSPTRSTNNIMEKFASFTAEYDQMLRDVESRNFHRAARGIRSYEEVRKEKLQQKQEQAAGKRDRSKKDAVESSDQAADDESINAVEGESTTASSTSPTSADSICPGIESVAVSNAEAAPAVADTDPGAPDTPSHDSEPHPVDDMDLSKRLEAIGARSRLDRPRGPMHRKVTPKSPDLFAGADTAKKPRKKEARKWSGQASKEDEEKLDFSVRPPASTSDSAGTPTKTSSRDDELESYTGDDLNRMMGDVSADEDSDLEDYGDDDDDGGGDEDLVPSTTLDSQTGANSSGTPGQKPVGPMRRPGPRRTAATAAAAKPKTGIFSFLSSLKFNRDLTDEDVEPILAKFRSRLMEKNVASEIAEKLCNSVKANLIGKNHSTLKSVSQTVRTALEEALTRILTPKRDIDVLRDILEKKRQGLPYVVVFCGVNGVGKSTNLAKTCFWLLQNNLKVMIAACDTFRSGAVEQLRVHATRLKVELFERGYGKDASDIAARAIHEARERRIDVVLVDTAGRMQDNEPLMRALAKLVNVNQPDLVLFVGEALVGNDAVDQLTKFNQALCDMADPSVLRAVSGAQGQPRQIDGIVLSKFDTVDEKVGAALSMVYTTGQPIVFVGTGQKYTDLRKFNHTTVTRFLLK